LRKNNVLAYHVVDGVVDGLNDLLVPVLAVLGTKQNVVHVHSAVELLGPKNKVVGMNLRNCVYLQFCFFKFTFAIST
jgi:hypothetical protein